MKPRPARLGDLPRLIEMEADAFGDEALSPRALRRHLCSPTNTVIVKEYKGLVVGCAIVTSRKNSHKVRLFSLAIDSEYCGRGFARELLACVEAASRSRHATHITLEVSCINTRAISLYKAAGYLTFGLYSHYYRNGCDALRMQKKL